MMKRFDAVDAVAFLILGIMAMGIGLSACYRSSSTMIEDPGYRRVTVGGVVINEVHPKPGVTCFVVHDNGISCFKD